MKTTPHGSTNQVLRNPTISAIPAVRNRTPRSTRVARVATRSSQVRPTWVSPNRVRSSVWSRPGGPLDLGVLDELEHSVLDAEPEDRGFDAHRARDQLPHVALDVLAGQ